MKLAPYLLIFVLMLTSVSAIEEYIPQIKEVEGHQLHSAVAWVFGDEKINVDLIMSDGSTIKGSIITVDGVVQTVELSPVAEPTMTGVVKQSAVENIIASEDKLGAFQQALDDDSITYSAVGVVGKIKLALVSVGATVVSWF